LRITITIETDAPDDYESMSVDLNDLVAYVGNVGKSRYTRIRLTEQVHPGVTELREFIGEIDHESP
jgi:hypothetical protein